MASDGMDIVLCIYEIKTGELQYAGAHNPLYLLKNGEIFTILADKQDIGSKYPETHPYTNHMMKVDPGDCIYLFSDGFPDQFGGPESKKYKYKKFRDFLITNHEKSMPKQSKLLETELANWMGNEPQVDDILVMGIRI